MQLKLSAYKGDYMQNSDSKYKRTRILRVYSLPKCIRLVSGSVLRYTQEENLVCTSVSRHNLLMTIFEINSLKIQI